MADATKDRKTESWPSALNLPMPGGYGVPAAAKVHKGTMQTLDANSRPKNPGATTERVIGVAADKVDNTDGVNDAKRVNFLTGPFKFALHGVNPPTIADVLKPAYASDNQTISKAAADGSLAGVILLVESDGVWVWVGPPCAAALLGALTVLTDNSGGVASDTIVDVPAAYDETTFANIIASLTAKINQIIAALN